MSEGVKLLVRTTQPNVVSDFKWVLGDVDGRLPQGSLFGTAVARGLVTNVARRKELAQRSGVAANTATDIWQGVATTIPSPPGVGEQMTVVSSSANDTAAGSGARTVQITYLDGSGVSQVETVTLNGAVGVNTVATDITFVQKFLVLTAGASGFADGSIDVHRTGDATVIYSRIVAGLNRGLSSSFKVPTGTTLAITGVTASSAAPNGDDLAIRLMSTSEDLVANSVFLIHASFSVANGGYQILYDPPLVFPAGTIIKFNALAGAIVTEIMNASWDGYLFS